MKPKLLMTRDDFPRMPSSDILEEMFEVYEWPSSEGRMPRDELLKRLKGCSALYCTPHQVVDKEALDHAGASLRVVSTYSVGHEHLDVEEMKKRGIRVGSVGYVQSQTVAEYNIGLAIATSRRFPQNMRFISSGEWARTQSPKLNTTIRGLTSAVVGIVGLGHIGLATAKLLKAFQVSRILYTSRSDKDEGKELGAERVSLDDLCKESDFIFITCALTSDTEKLVGEHQLRLMKSSAILINTSRGGLVDQEALIEALRENRIGGAGLDVMVPEPLPAEHPLLKLENCIVTPHSGSRTREMRETMSQITAENIIQGYRGEPMVFEL